MISNLVSIVTRFLSRKVIFEYIWLDGRNPATIRSITQTCKRPFFLRTSTIPAPTFAGFSTQQATESRSDCRLSPVRIYPNPFHARSYLVLCEVNDAHGHPHSTNYRYRLAITASSTHANRPLFGVEQEYYLVQDASKNITKSDLSYCGAGPSAVFSRDIAARHLDFCLTAGLKITGYNAEATRGQWEFQIGPADPLTTADHLIVARYILLRLCEAEDDLGITFHPAPVNRPFNMSGAHVNISDQETRCPHSNAFYAIERKIEALEASHYEAIRILGVTNEQRLKINDDSYKNFTYGKLDRSASIRIPLSTIQNQRGHFEDRRPGADVDPYVYFDFLLKNLYDL